MVLYISKNICLKQYKNTNYLKRYKIPVIMSSVVNICISIEDGNHDTFRAFFLSPGVYAIH